MCELRDGLDAVAAPLVPYIATTTWDSLRVGDIILCSNRESIPADVLLLASSRPDGRAMFETASLDGETNLKFRFVPNGANATHFIRVPVILLCVYFVAPCSELFEHGFATYERAQTLSATVTYDPPSPQLGSFRGICEVQLPKPKDSSALSDVSAQETLSFSISLENVALRGCKLRNTVLLFLCFSMLLLKHTEYLGMDYWRRAVCGP